MCGRYSLFKLNQLLEYFPWINVPPGLRPRYNIAPTQPVLAATNQHPDRFDYFHWGLIPSWAKDHSIGSRMINARAETLAQKPAFRDSFKRRRCLIPADGLYEWRKEPDGKTRTPMYIRKKDATPFLFAGLWDTWRDADGNTVPSCTIITAEPNDLVRPIHDRLAVILPPEHYDQWLDPGDQPADRLLSLLKPFPAEQMEAFPVSRAVNTATNDEAECIEPVASESLF